MLPITPELLQRAAHDVNVLWDEAQSDPALLRFLAPFGRPDLGRLTRTFLSVTRIEELVSEAHPVFATWLATLYFRELKQAGAPAMRVGKWVQPSWDQSALLPSLDHAAGFLLGDTRVRTVVIAGSLKAPWVHVDGACLVVAGDLETDVLIADGCVLVGGKVRAGVVSNPATHLRSGFEERGAQRALGWQVGQGVECRVFESPRFGLTCPVRADVVLSGVGLTPTADARERLPAILTDEVIEFGGLSYAWLVAELRAGRKVLR